MIVIGEKLNSTINEIRIAIENQDKYFVGDLAKRQVEAGATFVDINAGMFADDEPEMLAWLATVVQETVNAPLSIDSPNPKAIKRALEANKNPKVLINSINDEPNRFAEILPLVLEYNTSVIALCMGAGRVPETVLERMHFADHLVANLTKAGVLQTDIYLDPIVLPISTGSDNGNITFEAIRQMRAEFPEAHIACGLSNISFHLPERKLMNQAFLVAAIAVGLDSAILDPLDNRLMSMLYASEALFGKDLRCKNYLSKFREGHLER
jgi:cobalamin-dependent methionine synthase I